MHRPQPRLAIDLVKVLAAHLILFHHFVLYGPVPEAHAAWFERLVDLLAADGRLAVQVFLVIGGYLATGSMLSRLRRPAESAPLPEAGRLIVARARRLLPVYWLAAAAVLGATLWLHVALGQRSVETPTLAQIAANLLLLQDLLGHEGLSAGFWYVAVDLQLYALTCAVLAVARHWAGERHALSVYAGLTVALTLASLLWLNRHPELDAWGLYFAGSYGLGAIACLLQRRPAAVSTAAVALIGAIALALAWRTRIAVATLCAIGLCAMPSIESTLQRLPGRLRDAIHRLAAGSYPMFLLHYPVLLLVCGSVEVLSDGNARALALALALCWPVTVGLALVVQRVLDGDARGSRA